MWGSLKTAMFGPDRSGNTSPKNNGPDSPTAASPKSAGEEPVGEAQTPADLGVWENHGEEHSPESPVKSPEEVAAITSAASDHDGSSDVTPQERQKIQEMLRLLDEDGATADVWLKRDLLRFLRARRGDVKAALEMYRSAKQWRRENDVDRVLDIIDPNEAVFQTICPHRHHGWDFEGHPVYFEKTGIIRMDHLTKHVSEDEIVFRHVRQMEHIIKRGKESSLRLGKFVEKGVLVCDLKDLPYGPHMAGQRIFRRTTRIDQDFYPERLHKIIFINAPLSFRGIWAVIKPWLNPVTQAKIEIVGARYHDRLFALIPKEHIPAEYGGTCRCEYENGDTCLPIVRPYPSPPEQTPLPWPFIDLAQIAADSPQARPLPSI